jgi:antitoxin HicB
MLRYAVKFSKDTNGTILVDVPAAPEAHTFGEDRADALVHAVAAIETILMAYIDDRRPVPSSDALARGPFVTLPALTEAKLGLYSVMRAGRISKSELARRLKCHIPQVDRLLDLSHASRLDQLEAALRAVGKHLVVDIRAAA